MCVCLLKIIQPRQFVISFCLHVIVAKAYSDLNLFQKKHDINPLRGFLVPLVQVSLSLYTDFPVIFYSAFIIYSVFLA